MKKEKLQTVKIKKGMKVLVLGLGNVGIEVTKLLVKKGCHVTISDELNKTDLKDSIDELNGLEVTYELGKHVIKTFLEQDVIIVSPSVPLDIKPLQQAQKSGIPIMSELECAASFISEPIIAITGSHGKSTTAHLIAEILKAGGKKIFESSHQTGRPLSSYCFEKEKVDYIVCEVEANQLESTHSFAPSMIVFLNLVPEHLDRFKTYEQYIEVKTKIFSFVSASTPIVANLRDEKLVSFLKGDLLDRCFWLYQNKFSSIASKSSVALENPDFVKYFKGITLETPHTLHLHALNNHWSSHDFLAERSLLRGLHNRENMMAAILIAKLCGVDNLCIQKTIESFKPLVHRMEYVAKKNQVIFINDSKGSNLYNLQRSLESFDEPVILIAGGKDKGEDFLLLTKSIQSKVKSLILVGEAKERFNRAVGDLTETFLVGTFEEAVYLAYQKSRSGDTVLLSPGCSSDGMFRNYEERGDYFKKLIHSFR